MAERRKMAKTEMLTLRLDTRSRFILDYLSRVTGQTLSTVIERAIVTQGDATKVRVKEDGVEIAIGWRHLWDVKEPVRSLNLLQCHALHPTYEEERRLDFVKEFWPYFAADSALTIYKTENLDVLWPRLGDFINLRDATRTAGKALVLEEMNAALLVAQLVPPAWPPTHPGETRSRIDPEFDYPFDTEE